MSNSQKMRFFRHLVQIGFKEIEVSYPAASDSDFGFCRELLNGNEVPDDVWIQVRTTRRAELMGGPHTSTSGSDKEDI
jgi:2-isopropylmalate synthase